MTHKRVLKVNNSQEMVSQDITLTDNPIEALDINNFTDDDLETIFDQVKNLLEYLEYFEITFIVY